MKKTHEDIEQPKLQIWDENYEVFSWFRSMQSQFIAAPAGGVIGFNYLVAYQDFDDMGLVGKERDEWKFKLKIMEAASLRHLNKPA